MKKKKKSYRERMMDELRGKEFKFTLNLSQLGLFG